MSLWPMGIRRDWACIWLALCVFASVSFVLDSLHVSPQTM